MGSTWRGGGRGSGGRRRGGGRGRKENVKYFPTFPTNKLTNQPINCQSGARCGGGGSTRHGGGGDDAQLDWRIFHPAATTRHGGATRPSNRPRRQQQKQN